MNKMLLENLSISKIFFIFFYVIIRTFQNFYFMLLMPLLFILPFSLYLVWLFLYKNFLLGSTVQDSWTPKILNI